MQCSTAIMAIASAILTISATAAVAAPLPRGEIIVCDKTACGPGNAATGLRIPVAGGAHTLQAVRYSAHGRKTRQRASLGESGSIIMSPKTGSTARVARQYAGRFQAYVDDLEDHGARVLSMGGFRGHGPCTQRHKHRCGRALDVCQLSRGVVDARCHLPSPNEMRRIAAAHGLVEGGRWCHGDYGHAEVAPGAPLCAHRRYSVGRAVYPHGHRRRMARR